MIAMVIVPSSPLTPKNVAATPTIAPTVKPTVVPTEIPTAKDENGWILPVVLLLIALVVVYLVFIRKKTGGVSSPAYPEAMEKEPEIESYYIEDGHLIVEVKIEP